MREVREDGWGEEDERRGCEESRPLGKLQEHDSTLGHRARLRSVLFFWSVRFIFLGRK